jgi:pimeloyl-ACP methyl ester carboxylesterase
MRDGRRPQRLLALVALAVSVGPGCATMRYHAANPDLRPCTDGFTTTADGWVLGIRRFRPVHPDPGKHPVVLCHGLGLNATFWTLTDDNLPRQLAAHGYEVFVPDMRGSGSSHRVGWVGKVNARLRETPFNEIGDAGWNVDDEAFYDVPAILNFVQATTGDNQVNWVGHSLGGMLLFPYLEFTPEPNRIATFVNMGGPVTLAEAPDRDMLRSSRSLRLLMLFVSTGRLGRPLMYARPPGLDMIDSYYYTAENVDKRTIDRFYGYTLENPGRGAMRQLDPYLESGHMLSADRRVDYAAHLKEVRVPILFVAGEGDILASMNSMIQTAKATGSPDKTFVRFGRRDGHRADYGHCDLVWSRYAPTEIFPVVAAWLDSRQPGVRPSPQQRPADQQEAVEADSRPGFQAVPHGPEFPQRNETRVGQP